MENRYPPPDYIPAESKIPGIDVYMPAPQVIPEQREVVAFDCPQCGATTAFSVADGGLTCSHCGYHEAPAAEIIGVRADEYEFTVASLEQAARGWGGERKDLECQNCGSLTSLPVESLTHTCAFCGSNKVIQRETAQDLLRPRFLVPFKILAEQCRGITSQWLGSSWMTPASLKRLAGVQAFAAVYLPYWTFDAVTTASWKAEVGHTETERYYDAGNKEWRTRTVTVWRWESGSVRMHFDDLLVEGTARLSALLLSKMSDYDLSALVAYEPDYLAGFMARAYDVLLDQAWEKGRHAMRERTRQACRDQASTSNIRNFRMNLDFSDESWRYILLPVYVAAYRYGEQVYQVLINGQTGTISGQRPVDWNKVWLAIIVLVAPGLLIGLLGLATLPLGVVGVVIGGLGFVLLLVGLVVAAVIWNRAQGMDDA